MSIILNEYKWCEKVLEENCLGNKPYETLSRLARYYIYKGYSKSDTRKLLEGFLQKCDRSVSLLSWDKPLDSIIRTSSKKKLQIIDSIPITKPEIETIKAISGKQAQRLAFTLLCIAKYLTIVNPQTDHWVATSDSEIMKMANISTSIKRQSLLFSKLREQGLIKFSKRVDNLSTKVMFVQDGDIEMEVSDFRNLGYQYMWHNGGAFFSCTNCGIVEKIKERRPKYCADCAAKIHLKQKVESVMRKREAAKSQKH